MRGHEDRPYKQGVGARAAMTTPGPLEAERRMTRPWSYTALNVAVEPERRMTRPWSYTALNVAGEPERRMTRPWAYSGLDVVEEPDRTMPRPGSYTGLNDLFEKLLVDESLNQKAAGGSDTGTTQNKAHVLVKADLYFLEELWRTVGKRDAMNWLHSRQMQISRAQQAGKGPQATFVTSKSSAESSAMSTPTSSSPRAGAYPWGVFPVQPRRGAGSQGGGDARWGSLLKNTPDAQSHIRKVQSSVSLDVLDSNGLMYTDAAHLVMPRENAKSQIRKVQSSVSLDVLDRKGLMYTDAAHLVMSRENSGVL
jgi:hypothetical protein